MTEMDEKWQVDHDTIIQMATDVKSIKECLIGFAKDYREVTSDISILKQDGREMKVEVANLKQDKDALEAKSNRNDILLGLVNLVVAFLGVIFGNRQV